MKFWLPDDLYRLKPLILALIGAILIFFSDHLAIEGIGVLCLGFATYILIVRLLLYEAGTTNTKTGSAKAEEQKTHYFRHDES